MMCDRYILDDEGRPVKSPNLMSWAKWIERGENRVLAQTRHENVKVSTIFLGLDHSLSNSTPVLWETMIFGGEHDAEQARYTTREDALEGHKRSCVTVWGMELAFQILGNLT